MDHALLQVRIIQEALYPAYLHHQLQKLLDEAPQKNGGIKKLRDQLSAIVNDEKTSGHEKVLAITQVVSVYASHSTGFMLFKSSGIQTLLKSRLEKENSAMATALPPTPASIQNKR